MWDGSSITQLNPQVKTNPEATSGQPTHPKKKPGKRREKQNPTPRKYNRGEPGTTT
jgi:hypothetical protein